MATKPVFFTGIDAHGKPFWQVRATKAWQSHVDGRAPLYTRQDELMAACVEYFAWAEQHHIAEEKLFHNQGEIVHGSINHPRVFTLGALCLFLGIGQGQWRVYRKNPALADVCEWADDVIRTQKYTYAAVGMFNPGLVVRDLGLADVTAHKPPSTTEELQGLDLSKLSEEQLEAMERLLAIATPDQE